MQTMIEGQKKCDLASHLYRLREFGGSGVNRQKLAAGEGNANQRHRLETDGYASANLLVL